MTDRSGVRGSGVVHPDFKTALREIASLDKTTAHERTAYSRQLRPRMPVTVCGIAFAPVSQDN